MLARQLARAPALGQRILEFAAELHPLSAPFSAAPFASGSATSPTFFLQHLPLAILRLLVELHGLLRKDRGIVEVAELIVRETDVVVALRQCTLVAQVTQDRKRLSVALQRFAIAALAFLERADLVVQIGDGLIIADPFDDAERLLQARTRLVVLSLLKQDPRDVRGRRRNAPLIADFGPEVDRILVTLARLVQVAQFEMRDATRSRVRPPCRLPSRSGSRARHR